MTPPLVLASLSPRRRELITLLGLTFEFATADVDESPYPGEAPGNMVDRLSRAKAEIIASKNPDAIIVAADTTVLLDNTILGKPNDADDAVRMLKMLRNRPHIVYSGVTVRNESHCLTQIATTVVHMRNYSDAEIAAFVATGEPLDKAAAYAIQHNGFRPVERIEGCFANVMGLPLCHLYLALKTFAVELDEPDHACQAHLNIVCPVAEKILRQSVSQ